MTTGLSLYIHIPFCARKCRYCDFYSVAIGNNDADISLVCRYIDALAKELEFYVDSGIINDNIVNTIYVGGGTPSILGTDMWDRLDGKLFSRIDTSSIKEWTVECNPESFTMEKAAAYAKSGVTRLTFGTQSLNARELSICGRAYGTDRALEILSDYRLSRMFKSIGADIIYSLPGQTADTLGGTLSRLLSIGNINHLSAYELTVADDTPFGRHRKLLKLPNSDLSADMYYLINGLCADNGLNQYEISNYARPEHESVHNKAYWSHKPYIGLGASAHSYVHPKRWYNINDVDTYISLISNNNNAVDYNEILTPLELSLEIIFLGLRNTNGIDEDLYKIITGSDFLIDSREKSLRRFIGSGLLIRSKSKWIPTANGMLFADMMARELISQ